MNMPTWGPARMVFAWLTARSRLVSELWRFGCLARERAFSRRFPVNSRQREGPAGLGRLETPQSALAALQCPEWTLLPSAPAGSVSPHGEEQRSEVPQSTDSLKTLPRVCPMTDPVHGTVKVRRVWFSLGRLSQPSRPCSAPSGPSGLLLLRDQPVRMVGSNDPRSLRPSRERSTW